MNGVAIASLKLSPKDRIRAGKTLFSIGWETSFSESASVEGAGSIETMGPRDWADAAAPNNTGTDRPIDEDNHRQPIEDCEEDKADISSKTDERDQPDPKSKPIAPSNSDYRELPSKRKNISPFDSIDQSFAPENLGEEDLPWIDSSPAKSRREISILLLTIVLTKVLLLTKQSPKRQIRSSGQSRTVHLLIRGHRPLRRRFGDFGNVQPIAPNMIFRKSCLD